MSVQIRPFRTEDASLVASLHRHAIPHGFLSELGDGFLGKLYSLIACSSGTCVLVAVDTEDRCLGFIAGSVDIGDCYRKVMIKGAFPLLLLVLPNLFRPTIITRIIQTILYPLRSTKAETRLEGTNKAQDLIKAELLSIAVDESARGQGAGRILVDALEAFFHRNGISGSYRVVTDAEDPHSNAFYTSLGFQLQRTFTHHGHEMNQYGKAVSGMITESARG